MIINYQEGDTIELKSINLSFAIEQVYRNLDLTLEIDRVAIVFLLPITLKPISLERKVQ